MIPDSPERQGNRQSTNFQAHGNDLICFPLI